VLLHQQAIQEQDQLIQMLAKGLDHKII